MAAQLLSLFILFVHSANAFVANGVKVSDSVMPSVVRIDINVKKNEKGLEEGGLCTATAIAPNVLLAAAHCVLTVDGFDFDKNTYHEIPIHKEVAPLGHTLSGDFRINGVSFKQKLQNVFVPQGIAVYYHSQLEQAKEEYIKQKALKRRLNQIKSTVDKTVSDVLFVFDFLKNRFSKIITENTMTNVLVLEKAKTSFWEQDLAVIVFNEDVFCDHSDISLNKPKRGSAVALMGYGANGNIADFYEAREKLSSARVRDAQKALSDLENLQQVFDKDRDPAYYYWKAGNLQGDYDSGRMLLRWSEENAMNQVLKTAGIKHWGRNKIMYAGNDYVSVLGAADAERSFFGSDRSTGVDASVLFGDSGGPLFLIEQDAISPEQFPRRVVQVGVTSNIQPSFLASGVKNKNHFTPLYSPKNRAFLKQIKATLAPSLVFRE